MIIWDEGCDILDFPTPGVEPFVLTSLNSSLPKVLTVVFAVSPLEIFKLELQGQNKMDAVNSYKPGTNAVRKAKFNRMLEQARKYRLESLDQDLQAMIALNM